MSGPNPTVDMGRSAALACGLGAAFSFSMPAILPGVLFVCAMIMAIDG